MNTSKKSKVFDIIGGPSRDQIIDALKYAHDADAKIPIHFSIIWNFTGNSEDPGSCIIVAIRSIRIYSVGHKNRSGHQLDIEGHCEADINSPYTAIFKEYRFRTSYNTESKKGTITFFAK